LEGKALIDTTINEVIDGMRTLREFTNLHLASTMIDGGGADTGGINSLPHGPFAWLPGNPASFQIKPIVRPAGKPWDNTYLYNTLTKDKLNAIYFGLQIQFAFPTAAAIAASTAVEFELELCEAGLTYNMAWQYKHSKVDGSPAWRLFDKRLSKWTAIDGLPIPSPKPTTFVNAWAHFRADRDTKILWHDSIVIDGVFYPVNSPHAAVPKWSPQTFYLHNAVQLDSDGKGTAYGVLLKGWNARAL
jgi:hypothetical protein